MRRILESPPSSEKEEGSFRFRFPVFRREYYSYTEEKTPFPLSENQNLFALLWDLQDPSQLLAATLPRSTPFLYRGEVTPFTRTQPHSHGYMELFYVASGESRQTISGTELTVRQGEFCLMNRNCLHQEIYGDSPCSVLFLGIRDSLFQGSIKPCLSPEKTAGFLEDAEEDAQAGQPYLLFRPRGNTQEETERTLSFLLQELQHPDADSPLICRGLLLRLFRRLNTDYDCSFSRESRQEMSGLLFRQLTEFMKSNLRDMSSRLLSETFHFQEDYFNRLIKKHAGMTYTDYLQSLRLEKAEFLLHTTDHRIDRIAWEVGYHNKGYFYKLFTERHRLTPAQFRKQFRH